jgi:hypothetical protein
MVEVEGRKRGWKDGWKDGGNNKRKLKGKELQVTTETTKSK